MFKTNIVLRKMYIMSMKDSINYVRPHIILIAGQEHVKLDTKI